MGRSTTSPYHSVSTEPGSGLGNFTASSPLVFNSSTGNLSIPKATSSVDGYLSASDFSRFNSYITGVSSVFGRSGAVVATAGDYNTSQVTESGNLYFTNARGIASTLTGYTSGAGTISASDSILSAIQKLNGNIVALPSYTFSTGLTNASSIITANLSTGVAGGQSAIGGTASGDSLTLSSTSNATKGQIISDSQITWKTGLGAITHLLGPSDQPFAIASQQNSTGAANNLNLTASSASTASNTQGGTINILAGNGNFNGANGFGGDVNITAGNSAGVTSSPRGGIVTITGGNGFNAGGSSTSGQVNIIGGQPNISVGGQVNISTAVPTGPTQSAAINIFTGNAGPTTNAGNITLLTGSAGVSGGNPSPWRAGNFTLTTGTGNTMTAASGTAGNGGDQIFTLGAGAPGTGATATIGGRAGNWSVVGQSGGSATGTGVNTPGVGSSLSFVAGNAGNSSGGTTNNGVSGGGISFVTGNGTPVSSNSSTGGSFGVLTGNTGSTGSASNAGNITLTTGSSINSVGQIILTTGVTGLLSERAGITLKTSTENSTGGSGQLGVSAQINFITGNGNASTAVTNLSGGGKAGDIVSQGGTGGASSGNTTTNSLFGGTGASNRILSGAGGNISGTGTGGTFTAGNAGSIFITSANGGNATGLLGTQTGGNAGNINLILGSGGTGATANGTSGVFNIQNSSSTVMYSVNALGQVTGQVALLGTVTGINAQTIANTALYTVPAGRTAIITGVIIRCTAATSITAGPSLGIGNMAGTNNIFASAALTALTATTSTYGFSLIGMSLATAAAGVVYLNLGTASTGTSQTIAVAVMGYLV